MAKIGAALVVALVAIAFGKIILSMLGRFFRFWLKLPFFAKVVLPTVLVVFCLYGSMKNRGAFSVRSPDAATVNDIDIERGFKLESVVTNAAYSYELASNAVRNAAWHLAGGHSAFNRYNLGWSFPMGENTYDHIIAFQEGSAFHNPRDEYPLFKLYDGVLSFVPGYSDFWTLIDDQRGVFTWHNVVPYDKTNEVVSVQLELLRNGDFTIRSNEYENVYRRINPDDWDNDGLANEVDDAPKSYDGDFFGVASPLPEGALESAYYWIDLCVTGAVDTATVRVTCDGPSDLGDHVIIARTDEVFSVPLLKGGCYDVESTLPVFVVDQSIDNVDIWCNGCWNYHCPSVSHCYFRVNYYVDLWLENTGNLCELKSSENIGAAVSEVTGACCMSDITPLGFKWCCNASCNCDGGSRHYLNALVSWEGYSAYLGSSVYCTCMAGDAVETDGGAKISVSFKNDVIIFENSYTNAPNEVVPLRSTVNTLRVSAYGGEYGGVLEIDVDDGNRLVWCDGDILMSPIEIAAGEREELRIDYTACANSETINDIVAGVRFSEYFSGAVIDNTATMTAVRLAIEAEALWPENKTRHKFGPQETMSIRLYPSEVQNVVWEIEGDLSSGSFISYIAQDDPTNLAVKVSIGDSSFGFGISTIAPEKLKAIECRSFTSRDWLLQTGVEPGYGEVAAGMIVDLQLLPDYVSFKNVFLQEGTCEATNIDGFFVQYADALLPHGVTEGALTEVKVSDLRNYAGQDFAAVNFGQIPIQLESGSFQYNITNYWYVKSSENLLIRKNILSIEAQRISLDTNSDLSIEKYGCNVQRGTNNIVNVIRR